MSDPPQREARKMPDIDWKAVDRATEEAEAKSASSQGDKALRDALTRPITMQDVRLACGEGKLTPLDMLQGANAELRRRAALSPSPDKPANEPFPPTSCNAWEDCAHDGVCHDPQGCGGEGP